MKKRPPAQLIVGLGILIVGGAIVGGEYFLVKWYPGHKEAVKEATLKLTPFKNDGLGVEMQVAAGIDEKVEPFAGGVKIYAPKLWGSGPAITITTQPNPDARPEFTPQELAIWETDGAQKNLWRYSFEHTRINDRDAVLIWHYKNHAMELIARVISPDRIVEADCALGSADESLYMQACEDSLRTIKVAGTPSPPPSPESGLDVVPNEPRQEH